MLGFWPSTDDGGDREPVSVPLLGGTAGAESDGFAVVVVGYYGFSLWVEDCKAVPAATGSVMLGWHGLSDTMPLLKPNQAAFSFCRLPFSRARQSLCVEGLISTKKKLALS